VIASVGVKNLQLSVGIPWAICTICQKIANYCPQLSYFFNPATTPLTLLSHNHSLTCAFTAVPYPTQRANAVRASPGRNNHFIYP